mgnify:CR=1 FL=1
MQFLNLEMQTCEEDDAEFFHEKIDEISDSIVPPMEGAEDEYVFLKITDDEDKIIGGCIMEIDSWKIAELDILWVDEKYRRQGLGSIALQAVEAVAESKGCHLIMLGTWDFQAKPYYQKHGYEVFSTLKDCPAGHEDYQLAKRLDGNRPKRKCKPIEYELLDGSKEDAEYICDQLDEGYNKEHLEIKHDYIKINRKLINQDGKVVAAIMAGVTEIDTGWIWKIWVDEDYRLQGLGTLLLKHFEKKAKEKGATKIISEEIYDWNVGFFVKAGYQVAGELKDLPKGHTFYIVEKDLL